MFTVRLQRKDNDTFTDVKVIRLTEFNEAVADKANAMASLNNAYCQLMIGNDDPVPNGYSFKRLQYNTVIWKSTTVSATDALSALDNVPF